MRRVSVLVPARNEARYIEACIGSIRGQRFDGELEALVVDGRSQDATAQLARAAGASVVDNPERTIPAALNRGLAVAQGEVVIRFDAHAEMPEGYVERCLRALDEEPDAANVGGWRQAEGVGPWGRATAAALSSPFGVGNARIWRRPAGNARRRDVDTVPLGCFPAEALRQVGGWNEELLANEDFELNHRLRSLGRRVVFDPAIWSIYRPRETLAELARQYARYGVWKARMLRGAPDSLRPRQLAPVALAAIAATALTPTRPGRLARRGIGIYGATLLGVAARSHAGWRLAPVLATMHLTWGAGFLCGLVRRPPHGA